MLSFELDKTIEKIKQEGFICFFITINLEKDSTNLEDAKKHWRNYTFILNNLIQKEIITWGFTFITMEITENNLLHTHAIISLKNLTNDGYSISIGLKNLIRLTGVLDIRVNFLKDFLSQKRTFNYLYKDCSKDAFEHTVYFNLNNQQIIASLLDELDNQDFNYIADGKTIYLHDTLWINKNSLKKQMFDKISKINGVIYKDKTSEIDKNFDYILNLYVFFFLLNNIKEYNNILIKKIENSKISYEKWIEKQNLIKKWDDVVEFFLNNFNIYINTINIYDLKKNNLFLNGLSEKLVKINLLINLELKLVFTLIEFMDGIYSTQTNKFIRKDQFIESSFLGIGTLKYYKYTFKNLRQPDIWLKNIIKVLNYKQETILDLLMHLGIIFSNNYESLKKKRVLFILGESNTYKTTLIANIFTEFFGIDNVALMTQSKNFPFQNFNNKLIAVLDEFKYHNNLHNEYLKIFENREIIVEKKFENAIIINPLHIVILSNENFIENQKDVIKQNALNNRINTFLFTKQQLNESELQKLNKENIEIVIFLTKLYHEINKIKKDKRRKNLKMFLDNTIKKETLEKIKENIELLN